MSFKKITNSGFTLVELMVVVAIIGILSAIAIPNFKKYQAKSKTTEAKLQLAALYTAEISFSTDYDVFATCLKTMGYDPSDNIKTRYYAMGFASDVGAANTAAKSNGAPDECESNTGLNESFFPAGKTVGGKSAGLDYLSLESGDVIGSANDTFIASAAGIIDPALNEAATCSKWEINEKKQLVQKRTGY